MPDFSSLKPETRYGMPAADQILFNRHYVIGYSYYFRQAKWALEIVDPDKTDVERADNFRSDYRVPSMFRADLADYKNSGFDRGHLVASANQREVESQNSEGDSKAWKNGDPRRGMNMKSSRAEHFSPAGGGGLNTQPQKTKPRFC